MKCKNNGELFKDCHQPELCLPGRFERSDIQWLRPAVSVDKMLNFTSYKS